MSFIPNVEFEVHVRSAVKLSLPIQTYVSLGMSLVALKSPTCQDKVVTPPSTSVAVSV